MTAATTNTSKWWGAYQIPVGECRRWQIGPLTLWIHRLAGEWQVALEYAEDPDDDRLEVAVDDAVDSVSLMQLEHTARFGMTHDSESMVLTPMLADRPVITRPIKPFYVPAGRQAIVYMSSPLWLRVEVDDPPMTLTEFPIWRPSDTWFGPTTYGGELCYATSTSCRSRLADLVRRPQRALTSVTIENKASERLLLERMKLPVDYLPLFVIENGSLWTRDLIMTHVEDTELADVRYGGSLPSASSGTARLVCPARQQGDKHFALRVFGSLFTR